ncbi:hypothetical protein [Ectobacillus funiculus]|uniref:Phage abortive infection protein n=1 Tax=Ectobacillus funiculus TaxID=137993 RepID=A0ABV5WET2_9BACI
MKQETLSQAVKRALFKQKTKKIAAIIFWIQIVILVIVLCYLLQQISPFFKQFELIDLSDPTTAGLVGAFGGALISLLGSFFANSYMHKKQQESRGIVTRKNVIYSPLYDGLKALQGQIDSPNYPRNLLFNKNQEMPHHHDNVPHFYAWSRIKSDVRYTQVPSYLITALDNLEKCGLDYIKYRTNALKDIEENLTEIADKITSIKHFHSRIHYTRNEELLDKLLRNETIQDLNIAGYYKDFNTTITEEEYSLIKDCLNNKCGSLTNVENTRQTYEMFISSLNDLINGIETLMNFIHQNFEFLDRNI